LEKKIVLTNKQGMHARPASLIVERANKHNCDVFLLKDNRKVNAKSILGLLTLASPCGDSFIIETVGDDEKIEKIALDDIVDLFKNNFFED